MLDVRIQPVEVLDVEFPQHYVIAASVGGFAEMSMSEPAEFEHGVLVAFAVEDVISAREELAIAGIELIGGLVWAADVTGDPADQGSG